MTFLSVRAAPVVPDRGPERSGRAVVEQARRRVAAARVRPYNRVAAAEIESPSGVFRRHWLDSLLASEANAAARRREAEIVRQVAEARRQEDCAERRAAFRMAQDRARFYRARGRS
jgi:hypothetical protein